MENYFFGYHLHLSSPVDWILIFFVSYVHVLLPRHHWNKNMHKANREQTKSLKIYSFLYLKNIISVYHTCTLYLSFQKPKINLNPSYILTHLSSWMTLFLGEAISDMVLLNTFCCVSSISFIAMFSMWGGCSKKHLVETWDSTRGGVFSKPWLQYKYST